MIRVYSNTHGNYIAVLDDEETCIYFGETFSNRHPYKGMPEAHVKRSMQRDAESLIHNKVWGAPVATA